MAALAPELRATLRALHARRIRSIGPTYYAAGPLLFGWGGVGPVRAARCAADLLARYRPAVLVSTGFAGALEATLRPGAVVAGGAVGFPADPAARRMAGTVRGAREGETRSVERVLLDAAEKDEIFRGTGALAVDMEAAALGALARERGVGFLCVKAILDTPDAPLASRYEGIAAIASEMIRNPGLLRGMLADFSRARLAGRALAEFYREMSRRLDAGS